MGTSNQLLRGFLLAAAAVLLAFAADQLRHKKHTVDDTTRSIEDQLAALDTDTRAAVIARLPTDSARKVKDRFGH